MYIAWDNKADAASLTTDSEQASLPASNVQQAHLSRKWQTAAGVKSAYIVFDLGSSLACGLLAVLGSNLAPAATLRLRGSVTDPTGAGSLAYDSGTIAAGAVSGYGAAYHAFTGVASRYWRLDLADASVPDNLQAGRVFLGPKWTPAIGMAIGGSVTPVDPSRRGKSYGGQAYANELPQFRVMEFTLDFQAEAEIFANAFAMARANGIVRDVLAIPDIGGTYLSQQAVYGLLEASEPIVNDKLNLYRQKFRIEERL